MNDLYGLASPVLKIKRLDKSLPLPAYATPGSAGIDLYAAHDSYIMNMSEPIGTGIQIALPEGYAGVVRSRSGLYFKHDVVCFHGLIDWDYRGELKVKLEKFSLGAYTIKKGDRIAQLTLPAYIGQVKIVEVQKLDETERGCNGFGSTGGMNV